MSPSAITGAGLLAPDALETAAVAELLQGQRLRSLNREATLLLATARLALRDAGIEQDALEPDEVGIVVATRHAGHDDYVALFLAGVDPDSPFVSPVRGPQTGMNAPAAILSIRLQAAGPNATLSNGAVGGLDAMRYADDALAGGRAAAMLVCAVDVVQATDEPAGGAGVLVLEADAGARRGTAAARAAVVAGVATAHAPRGDHAEALARSQREALDAAGVAADAADDDLGVAHAEDSVAAVAQLADAAARVRRGERGPLVVRASDAGGGAGAAVLVEPDWRAA